MTALEAGQCVAKLVRGPLDGATGIIRMIPSGSIPGELVPPAVAGFVEPGHDPGCPGAVAHPYRLDVEQMVIEADGTEVHFYLHAPSEAPA